MGKCSNCGKKIEYNRFKMYRDKVLCNECYATRLVRKKAKKKAGKELKAKELENVASNYGYNDYKIKEQEDKKKEAETMTTEAPSCKECKKEIGLFKKEQYYKHEDGTILCKKCFDKFVK